MNWNKIIKNCPQTIEELRVFYGADKLQPTVNAAGSFDLKNAYLVATIKSLFSEKTLIEESIDDRYFYDFFDTIGIYIYLDPCACHNPPIWNYLICIHNEERFIIGKKEKKTRKAIEDSAFKRAFKIREKQLKRN